MDIYIIRLKSGGLSIKINRPGHDATWITGDTNLDDEVQEALLTVLQAMQSEKD